VQGAVLVHAGRPDAEHEGRSLAVAVLLEADGTVVVEFDDLQRTGLLFAVPPQRRAVVLLIPAAAVAAGKLFCLKSHPVALVPVLIGFVEKSEKRLRRLAHRPIF